MTTDISRDQTWYLEGVGFQTLTAQVERIEIHNINTNNDNDDDDDDDNDNSNKFM